jgi:hypothetical protein
MIVLAWGTGSGRTCCLSAESFKRAEAVDRASPAAGVDRMASGLDVFVSVAAVEVHEGAGTEAVGERA